MTIDTATTIKHQAEIQHWIDAGALQSYGRPF